MTLTVGLLLPPATGIAPTLALAAAIGFAVLQVQAAGVHISRDGIKDTGLTIALLVLATLAAWLATT